MHISTSYQRVGVFTGRVGVGLADPRVTRDQGGGGTWIPNTGWEGGGGPAGGQKKNSAHDLFLSQTVCDGRIPFLF